MNTAALATELVKIIKSGDDEYAGDYFEHWCSNVVWTPTQAKAIRGACELAGIDPGQFKATQPPATEAPTERITYEWKDSE